MSHFPSIDQSWTLFLDRDGVINQRNFDGYILQWPDFHFAEGLLAAAAQIGHMFSNIFVVTNQQCVAKGLISETELQDIHQQMSFSLAAHGLKIREVKAAFERKGEAPFRRKPNTTMALELQETYASIDFKKSIMVGDTDADIQFGKDLGMYTVLVRSKESTHLIADLTIESLADLPKYLL